MATIKAIEGRSIHQIQSGQVIVDLTSVVKELVENSLDAGAKKIDVRFKNHGLDSIEVQDDGNGIAPEDFPSVALKHHTSKLRSFEDLDDLGTFGFRGEALSSLCALSKVSITTARSQDGAVGRRLDFEMSGKLKSTTIVAATRGTSVLIENIFYNLPVRRKELEKNAKREWNKVLKLMYEYACISIGIRMSLSHQPSKGKKHESFSTKGNTTTKENIANCFTAKTLAYLLKLELQLELTPSNKSTISRTVQVEGHISRPGYGEGRQTPDRQMYYVNSRPCSLPQISKVFNEVYRSFNHHQSPFILANFLMDTNSYDVNVSPDKRTIMFQDQTALLDQLRTSLAELFQNSDHILPQSQLPAAKLPAYKALTVSRNDTSDSAASPSGSVTDDSDTSHQSRPRPAIPQANLVGDWAGRDSTMRKEKTSKAPAQPQRKIMQGPEFADERVESSDDENLLLEDVEDEPMVSAVDVADKPRSTPTEPASLSGHPAAPSYDDVFLQPAPKSSVQPHNGYTAQRSQNAVNRLSQRASQHATAAEPAIPSVFNSMPEVSSGPINDAFARMRPRRVSPETAEITIGDSSVITAVGEWPSKKRRIHTHKPMDLSSTPTSSSLAAFAAPGSQLALSARTQAYSEHSDSDADIAEGDATPIMTADDIPGEDRAAYDLGLTAPATAEAEPIDSTSIEETEAQKKEREDRLVAQLIQDAEKRSASRQAAQRSSMPESRRKDHIHNLEGTIRTSIEEIRYGHRRISAPEPPSTPEDDLEAVDAESKLSLTVNKADFERMRIVGQFNLGFILAVRPGEDGAKDELFIIDQHAADEKANYERLQSTVVLQSQPLVQPKLLELTAVEEEVVSNHQDALQANGFDIEATEHDDSSRSYRLLTLPTSRNTTFKLTDLEELMHLLSELSVDSNEIPRPRKVQKILAMRACRSSIMVGKTLSMKQMTKVVRHMGGMEKPWNCPHGRPTMRHLTSLGAWQGWQEGEHPNDEELVKTDWQAWMQSMS